MATVTVPPGPTPAVAEDLWIAVDESAAVATARRRAAALASAAGLAAERVGEVEIVASELATNIVKHGGGGDLVLRPLPTGGLQLVAVDAGPGTRDLEALVDDGISTAGTLGVGLGAVRRLATRLRLWSAPSRGAVVTADLGARGDAAGPDPAVGHLARTIRGESVCGDTIAHREVGDGGRLLMVADGLGHGPLAAEASGRAGEVLRSGASDSPAELVRRMHAVLGSTRGAAVAVARVDPGRGVLVHAGVGNISGRLLGTGRVRSLVSQPGIVGHKLPRVQETTYPIDEAELVVLHSDGLTERWDAAELPSVRRYGPTVVAAALLRDAGTRRDDASVLVMRVGR